MMTNSIENAGTFDFRATPSNPWLPFALAALALSASNSQARATYTDVVVGTGAYETISLAYKIEPTDEKALVSVLARIHSELNENAYEFDTEVQGVIDAHLWELYS